MNSPQVPPKKRVSRGRVVAGASVVLAAVVAFGAVTTAIGARAQVLGKASSSPRPACPTPKNLPDPIPPDRLDEVCRVSGQVTGFQRKINGKGGPFKVKQNGRIVAWSIDLSRPNKRERKVFGEGARTASYGEKATAGISILRPKGGGEFRLVRQSPILRVDSHFGDQPIFTLDQPLRVRKGQIVAITTVTWLPFLGTKNVDRNNTWLASRTKSQCEIPNNIPDDEQVDWFFDHTRPQRKVGSTRKYKCVYDSTRLLYRAYFAPARPQ